MKFISAITFPPWLGKSVNLNFQQYQSNKNNNKFHCCFEIQPKTVTRNPIGTLNSLKLSSNQIQISC